MQPIVETMMQSIRRAVCGATVEWPSEPFPEEALGALYRLSDLHDLAHVVGHALEEDGRLSPSGEAAEQFRRKTFLSVYRYQQLQYTYERICRVLDAVEIDYIPLKGALIRAYYPEPWMRTSCDIDILVHESDAEEAAARLADAIGVVRPLEREYHDISLFLEGNIHLELHFSLSEHMERMDRVLERVWDYATPAAEGTHRYVLENAFFLFHQVAHCAYHFANGGCGVRPLIDWWLLRRGMTCDEAALSALLEEADLAPFAVAMERLSGVWFSGDAHDELTRDMEAYLLGAGVYGSFANSVALANRHHSGRFAYFMHRVFMPYRNLKAVYPVLERYPVLYPFCTVCRWGRLLFGKARKKAVLEIKYASSLSDDKTQRLARMCRALHLD